MEETKKLIRSLLISSPMEMTVGKLDNDYYELEGERIPYRKLGYASLESFLFSIPDVVEVLGQGKWATVRVVADDKVAHIDRLVSLQRAPQVKRNAYRNRPRRRKAAIFEHPPPLPQKHFVNQYVRNYQPNCYIQPTQHHLPLSPVLRDYHGDSRYFWMFQNYGVTRPFVDNSNNHNHSTGAVPKVKYDGNPCYTSKNTDVTINKEENSTPKPHRSVPVQNDTSKDKSKDTTFYNDDEILLSDKPFDPIQDKSDTLIFKEETTISPEPLHCSYSKETTEKPLDNGNEVYYSDNDFSDDEVVESESSKLLLENETTNYKVPFKVQECLKQLISKYSTDGVWCRDVPRLYKEMFKVALEYEEYGYRSLIQMCLELDSIFYCFRPSNGDFILYDNTMPLSAEFISKLQEKYKCHESFEEEKVVEVKDSSEEVALHYVKDYVYESNREKFPQCVMKYDDEIPAQWLPVGTVEGQFIDVVVGEVYDPSKFWIILVEKENELNSLMDELQLFYYSQDQELRIQDHFIKEGLYCVACYLQEFHRAIIVKHIPDNKSVKVFFVDYGTLSTVSSSGLYFLHKQFAQLPRQAIRGRLASIWPRTAFTPWSTSASNRFLALVRNKQLVAHIYKIHQNTRLVEMFLADTTTEKDIYMNDTLVEEGYAFFTNQEQNPRKLHPRKIPKYRYIHLYPNFEDLENGNVPSATEIYRMSKIGIQPEYLYPNYYEDITDEHDESLLYHHHPQTDVTSDCVVEKNWAVQIEEQEEYEHDSFQENASYHAPSTLSDTSSPLNRTVDIINNPFNPNLEAINNPLNSNMDVINNSSVPEDTVPKTKVNPPPGFENISLKNQYSVFTRTTTIPTVTVNNLHVPTPQVLIPNAAKISQLLNPVQHQGLAVQPLATGRQTSQPIIENYNQNILINSVNPYIYSNPSFNQTNNLLCNRYLPQQQMLFQPHNRTILQSHVHKSIMEGNFNLLRDVNNILNKLRCTPVYEQIYLLMNRAFEIINNPLLMTMYAAHFGMVLTNILNFLSDEEVLGISAICMIQSLNVSNGKANGETLRPENEKMVNVNGNGNKLITCCENTPVVQESVNYNTNKKEESKLDVNVQEKPKVVLKSSIIKTELQNQPIHIILYDNLLYVPVNEVLQYTSPKPTLDIIRKAVMLLDPQNCVKTIYLTEVNPLTDELRGCGFTGQTLVVLPLFLLPQIVKIHHGEMEEIKDFDGFLKKVIM